MRTLDGWFHRFFLSVPMLIECPDMTYCALTFAAKNLQKSQASILQSAKTTDPC